MLAAAASITPMHQHAARLNEATERSLSAEWEVAILLSLAQFGSVVHEPTMAGKRPDILFRNAAVEFVADVVTVNDDGYEAANPYRAFEQEFWRRLRKSGIPPHLFSYKIGVDYSTAKTRLLLPSTGRWCDLFNGDFENMLACARMRPDAPVGVHRKADNFDVMFWYSPVGQGTGQSAPYRDSASLTQNPIYNALRRKREQLKLTLYAGLKGIILCDGDCQQLRLPERIVELFLRRTKTISFVAVCTLRGDRVSHPKDIRVQLRVFTNKSCTSDSDAAAISDLLTRAIESLPPADDDITNACNHLRWKTRHVGLGHHGGYTWGGDYVRISSRALVELLAGAMTSEEFMRIHRFDEVRPGFRANPFACFLEEGRMIRKISVDPSQTEDDDWIEFEFGDRDPAISDFEGLPPRNG